MDARRRHRASRPAILALLLVAAAAMTLLGAAVPHTHAGAPGLYNQEHDLTLYAIAGSAALLTVAPALFVDAVLAAIPFVAAPRVRSIARTHADSRAPPAA